MANELEFDIFLSHSTKDKTVVRPIAGWPNNDQHGIVSCCGKHGPSPVCFSTRVWFPAARNGLAIR